MKRTKPFFRASVGSDGVLEMLVYEQIGADYWDDSGITAKSVKQQIDQAGMYSSILLRINSPGGDAFEGVAIGNLLRSTGKPVNVCVDGIAASAASIIAMAGTTITMASNAIMMIHKAWSYAVGNADDMRKTADSLDKVDGAIAQTYVDRTGKPKDDVMELMKAETWMSAQDCLDAGFCTTIADPTEAEPVAMAMARKFKALARYAKVPKSLKPTDPKAKQTAGECACDCQACSDGECENCSNSDCTDRNCEDCPMQSGTENTSNLSTYQAIQHGIDQRQKQAVPASAA
jgi:ATP-dependent Clp protease protease subunit